MSYHGLGALFSASASVSTSGSASGSWSVPSTGSVQQTNLCGPAAKGPGCCTPHGGVKAFTEDTTLGRFSAICTDGWEFARSAYGQPVVSSAPSTGATSAVPPPPPPAAAPPSSLGVPIKGGACPVADLGKEPSGLSATYRGYYPADKRQVKICNNLPTDYYELSRVFLCNMSSNPNFCLLAKKEGKAFLGRGTAADIQKWRAWMPAEAPAAAAAPPLDLNAAAAAGAFSRSPTTLLATARSRAPASDPVPASLATQTDAPPSGIPLWLIAAGGLALLGGALYLARNP